MLEVRENASPLSLDILEKSFNMLEYLGVRLAVDHFGSGSFSLRYLKALTVSYLKLDASLISDMTTTQSSGRGEGYYCLRSGIIAQYNSGGGGVD